jgi:hypothetical protein
VTKSPFAAQAAHDQVILMKHVCTSGPRLTMSGRFSAMSSIQSVETSLDATDRVAPTVR